MPRQMSKSSIPLETDPSSETSWTSSRTKKEWVKPRRWRMLSSAEPRDSWRTRMWFDWASYRTTCSQIMTSSSDAYKLKRRPFSRKSRSLLSKVWSKMTPTKRSMQTTKWFPSVTQVLVTHSRRLSLKTWTRRSQMLRTSSSSNSKTLTSSFAKRS